MARIADSSKLAEQPATWKRVVVLRESACCRGFSRVPLRNRFRRSCGTAHTAACAGSPSKCHRRRGRMAARNLPVLLDKRRHVGLVVRCSTSAWQLPFAIHDTVRWSVEACSRGSPDFVRVTLCRLPVGCATFRGISEAVAIHTVGARLSPSTIDVPGHNGRSAPAGRQDCPDVPVPSPADLPPDLHLVRAIPGCSG